MEWPAHPPLVRGGGVSHMDVQLCALDGPGQLN